MSGEPEAPNVHRTEKSGAQLARQIEEEILAAGWPVGKRLGSEPELMERYGVSRNVMREAVRLLEHLQVATTKEGRGGGLVVMAPDPSAVVRGLELYLSYVGVSLTDLLQTKRALELDALRVAMQRLTSDGEERLRSAIEAERITEGRSPFQITDDNLHIALAELSGNPATHLFVQVLTRLTALLVERSGAHGSPAHFYDIHGDIALAVLEKDPERATKLMTEHLDEVEFTAAEGAVW